MRLFAALLTSFLIAATAALGCSNDAVELRHEGTQVRFAVEVAATPEDRATGLMFRESMPMLSGMLFVYERPQPVAFWMKNTLISLDMLFMDETGTVKRIARNTTPLSTDSVPGGNNILFVLEINGGTADALGIDVGAQMRHTTVDQNVAAWPCDDQG